MACTLIDVHKYGKDEKETEIPQEPVCLPDDIQIRITLKIIAVMLIMFALMMALLYFNGRLREESGGGPAASAAQSEEGGENNFSFFDIIIPVGVFGASVFLIRNVQENAFNRLQNPIYNPKGCKYQGRILSKTEDHYRLHLDYYNAHGTWTLPDELERGGD
ncbi:hypothetical protein IJT93_02425 [bacterium]|nr:hypothetical protein [bacterium]